MKLIGLDVGTKRIGIAKADTSVRIAVPDGVVIVNGDEFAELARISRLNQTKVFVIGLPRNSQGLETNQTAYVRNFAKQLSRTIPGCRIYFQDESLTSIEAENRLKARKKTYQKSEIDSEAAAIILQDCIEQFTSSLDINSQDNSGKAVKSNLNTVPAKSTSTSSVITVAKNQSTSPLDQSADSVHTETMPPAKKPHKLLPKLFLVLFLLILAASAGGYYWYQLMLQAPIKDVTCPDIAIHPPETPAPGCRIIKFTIKEKDSVATIAENLQSQKLIQNALVFQVYLRITNQSAKLKSGEYSLRESMTVPELVSAFVQGTAATNVFNFTILPGETIPSIKAKLINHGYSEQEITAALTKDYSSHPELSELLASKPKEVSLEGYLYGETYQFYKQETVENILIRVMRELAVVVKSNHLVDAYQKRGLTLHQGITLASIVQKEAKSPDQPGVAQVFLLRYQRGEMLGSDVTASYAANLLDPERKIYNNNDAILKIDSPYNTRKKAGLPPGAISSPGLSALLAVSNPAEASYLYFLTGDDGKMYYSHTESEHNQKITAHCRSLCNAKL